MFMPTIPRNKEITIAVYNLIPDDDVCPRLREDLKRLGIHARVWSTKDVNKVKFRNRYDLNLCLLSDILQVPIMSRFSSYILQSFKDRELMFYVYPKKD